MSLPVPYPVYGTITENSTPVNGATVNAQDTTLGSAVLQYTTGSNGKYQINLQTIATDGDTITVWVTYSDKMKSSTFTLDVASAAKKADLSPNLLDCLDYIGAADTRKNNLTKNNSDIIGSVDAKTIDISKTLTDSIGSTDTRKTVLNSNITDIIGAIDSSTRLLTKTNLDSIGLTDTKKIILTKMLSDILGLYDTNDLMGLAALFLELTDIIGANDIISQKTLSKTLTDILGMLDTALKNLVHTESDKIGAKDTALKDLAHTEDDIIGLKSTSKKNLGANLVDSIGVADTRSITIVMTLNEAIELKGSTNLDAVFVSYGYSYDINVNY